MKQNIFCAAALLATLLQPASAQVTFTIDADHARHAISPLIYGVNFPDWKDKKKTAGVALARIGGNRITAYNWETNASNAGSDYLFQNDSFMGGGETPGEALRPQIAAALAAKASIIVTVPMAGYVAADKNGDGDVNKTPDYLNVRFVKSYPKKGKPFVYPPNTSDKAVYQDEFVSWVEKTFPTHRPALPTIFYALDNEADIWGGTHARIRPQKLTYAELRDRTVSYASAIKAVAPKALIFGPVSYGWQGFRTLQDASDANGRDFLDFYLAEMKSAEKTAGKRLLDVLDIHWYTEVNVDGKRITDAALNTPAAVAARVQATRSLWDTSYTENSWIARDALHGPIALLPRLKGQIAKFYPGTKLAITEYNYGGGKDISGAVTQADALGIFGRDGLFAATFWGLADTEPFIFRAFAMFRNYDGKGGRFGDTSVSAKTSDTERSSIYASVDSRAPGRMVLVALNKTTAPLETNVSISAAKQAFRRAAVYRLTADSPESHAETPLTLSGKSLHCTLPPMSVTTFVLSR